jgi:uncharacterized protein YbjT (DUF2867 family)
MTNVLILGASGNIASNVIDLLSHDDSIRLNLFLRKAGRLRNRLGANSRVIEGDVLNLEDLREAMTGVDIVYANLAGDLEQMAKHIVKVMNEKRVKRLIFISSIGIYAQPLKPVLKPYRRSVDVIEASDLDYTVLRPTWFTTVDEVDYELTRKGEPEKGSVISQRSLATFIATIIKSPEQFVRESLGINKPAS